MMPLFSTAEIRWFCPGKIPGELDEWFHQGNLWSKAEVRTDSYLYFPQSHTSGVKFREGRFEIKALVAKLGLHRFPGKVQGYMEGWEKWSLEILPQEPPTQSIWLDIRKQRSQRRFALMESGVTEIAADTFPDQGGSIELTQVYLQGKPWWSLAVEAFGKADHTAAVLEKVAEHFFTLADKSPMFDPRYFTAERSRSYPAWLQEEAHIKL